MDRRLSGRRRNRHFRPANGSIAFRAARPAVRGREPGRRRQQYRHRSGPSRAGDGYTLLGTDAAAAINATLYDNLNFNFIRDIALVGIIRGPFAVLVHPSVPAKTVPEFIAYAKANPGKISKASAGTGNPTHMAGELFKVMTAVEMTHVPYRGAGPAITDLLGGQVQIYFGSMPAAIEHIRSESCARWR